MSDQAPTEPSLSWARIVELLAAAGCVAPEDEARELLAAAVTGEDEGDEAAGEPSARLARMVERRAAGEPLAWVTGWVEFGGSRVRVDPGVYVPRAQSEILVAAALEVLGADGVVVDLCTGSGAVAVALQRARPDAQVIAADVDPVACSCARANGVTVFKSDLDAALPPSLAGRVDLVTAVAPYVPTRYVEFLPRDARDHEPGRALDGGGEGIDVLRGVVEAAARLLRPGGVLVIEVGGDQDRMLAAALSAHGFAVPPEVFRDEDGDLRALRARHRGKHRVHDPDTDCILEK